MNKELDAKKTKLKKELAMIEREELKLLIDEHYPAIKKQFEGKYFKYENGYNSEDRWFMYIHITEIKKEDVYDTHGNGVAAHYHGWSFQFTSNKEVAIDVDKQGYCHLLEQEISKKEFYQAWNKMIKQINNLP